MKRIFVLVAYFLFSIFKIAFGQNKQTVLDNYYYLYRSSDGAIKAIDKIKIDPIYTAVKNITQLDSLLDAANIFQDAEAYNLIYILNPELKSIKGLKQQYIQFPSFDLQTKNTLSKEKMNGYSLIITTYYSEKNIFFKSLNLISSKYDSISTRKIEIANKKMMEIIKTDFDTIAICLNNRSNVLDRTTLSQINSECSLFINLLDKDTLTDNEKKTLGYLHEDCQLISNNLLNIRGPSNVSEPYPMVEIAATILDSRRKSVNGLRISFVAKALISDSASFKTLPELSSPATARLPVANYFFWATQPGDKSLFTDRIAVELRVRSNQKPFQIELALLPKEKNR